ncbi:hypothetical protein BJX70DRAFT_62669 [Aspergillus crustosus]
MRCTILESIQVVKYLAWEEFKAASCCIIKAQPSLFNPSNKESILSVVSSSRFSLRVILSRDVYSKPVVRYDKDIRDTDRANLSPKFIFFPSLFSSFSFSLSISFLLGK